MLKRASATHWGIFWATLQQFCDLGMSFLGGNWKKGPQPSHNCLASWIGLLQVAQHCEEVWGFPGILPAGPPVVARQCPLGKKLRICNICKVAEQAT